jgi:hypothetical protein
MKQLSVLILLSLLAISCKKAEETKNSNTGSFTITGIKDVDLSVSSDGRVSFPISVVPTSGVKDTVKLSADLVPGGVYCSFVPSTGVLPFNSIVTVSTDFSSAGGTYPFKIKGVGSTGTNEYDIKVTLAPFRGWQLGSDIYEKTGLTKSEGTGVDYPYIVVSAPNGAQLRVNFAAQTRLPKVTTTYNITSDTGRNNIQIAMAHNSTIWSATGKQFGSSDAATGTFTIDTLKRFTFKCSNVEMSDGLQKKSLSCSFSE